MTTPLGWGYDPYGTSPYGAAAAGVGGSIASALAISTHEVEVTVNGLAQDNSPYFEGDALNPATWGIVRLDTGDSFTPTTVAQVNPSVYRILCLEEFGPYTVVHRVSSTTLHDASGNLIHPPYSADFRGVLDEHAQSSATRLAARKLYSQDLANPPFSVPDSVGGTLVVTAGDYATVTGPDLVKKLIIRRLTTGPGDFFHLPNYGAGIQEKMPVRIANLTKMKADIENQVKLEPEVQDALASLTIDREGILLLQLQVQLKPSGQSFSFNIPLGRFPVSL